MRIADDTISWQEAAARWKAGDPVWSGELGGLGPGYEQAIQILLFEIMVRWGDRTMPKAGRDELPPEYLSHVESVAHDLDKACRGFSGAQVGMAKVTAYQFMVHGYAEMLAKLDFDRKIQVSRHFPHVPGDA